MRGDFRRQNLTYMDVRFWRLKSVPALEVLSNYSPRKKYIFNCKMAFSMTFGYDIVTSTNCYSNIYTEMGWLNLGGLQ